MKNKKGFTLAELLGVIVILLLLVLIVTPLLLNYTKKASDSVYDVQIKTIRTSAKEWASDSSNIKLLPTEENECIEVSLEKLKEAGYLDYNIKNPKTNEKFDDNLTVIIRKEGKSLTYTFNEDGTQVCSTVVTTDYPKWVYISSTPHLASSDTEVTVLIESNKKISEYNVTADDIQVKVGSTINENANVTINCNNSEKLSCEVKISNLEGEGRLALVIDKDVMKDEDLNSSRITSLLTDTVVDASGPIITYTGRTNTNPSLYYATKDDEVVIKFKAEDEQDITSNLTANDIKVYINGVEITCDKELTQTGSGKTINYALKLANVLESGKASIKVASGKITDSIGNTNSEKTITPGITFDNIKPTISFTPNEETRYLQNLTSVIDVVDNETGVDDSTIKYIVSTNSNATPNTQIGNGGQITIKDVTGHYYIIGYACDYAGNCNTGISGIYNMNNSGPGIEITPTGNTGYAKSADIKIKVTQNGTALDEGSFVYTISTDSNATPDKTFINNQKINIPVLTGIYYVVATGCDMDSNCSTAVSGKFYFDNEAPDIKINPMGTNNVWKKNQSVNIEVTDNIELDWSKYVISTSKTATPNVAISNGIENKNITGLTGDYYIVVKACDKLNNCNQINSDIYKFDNANPGIGNISVTPNASTKKITSTVTVTDNVALAKYEIYNPSGTKVVDQPISGTSYNVSYQQNAAGTYKLRVYDHLNNYSEKSFTIPSYKVTFVAVNGTITPGTRTVNYGATTTATNTPTGGYHYNSLTCTNSQTASHSNGTITTGAITNNTTCTITNVINSYTVTFASNNTNMGTVSPTSTSATHGGSVSATISPKSGYKYKSVSGTGCSVSGNTVTASNVTSARTCTVTFETACTFTSQDFGYTGGVQSWTVPAGCAGTYKLEVWGAQGGGTSGGKGGYASGNVALSAGTTVYVVVGGAGAKLINSNNSLQKVNGGYNGGGYIMCDYYNGNAGSGGGATHIGTFNSTLAAHGNTSGLYIVAGGGGGSGPGTENIPAGGYGGGATGGNGTGLERDPNNGAYGLGGTQSAGGRQSKATNGQDVEYMNQMDFGSFGQGGSQKTCGYDWQQNCSSLDGTSNSGAGGGGGLYGGGAGRSHTGSSPSAGGGSGYIGGVSNGSNKGGNETFVAPGGGNETGHAGNGYARITKVG